MHVTFVKDNNSIYKGNIWAASYLVYQLIPSVINTAVIGNRLRDVIMLVYATHAFDDYWKLSLLALKAVRNFILTVMFMII